MSRGRPRPVFRNVAEPIEGVRLGGVMFIDAVLAKTAGGVMEGWKAPGVPDIQLTLSGEWETPFAPGLTLNGRRVYTSSQYLDTTLRLSQPSVPASSRRPSVSEGSSPKRFL
jgi:hypothetical protein